MGTMDAPVFHQINLVVGDMDAAVAFYRRLGLDVHEEGFDWPPGSGARHVEITLPNGTSLELDNLEGASLWYPDVSPASRRGSAILGFTLPSAEAVDELYASLVDAGHPGLRPPYDAFWGGRYAIVEDPDHNQIGLMGPIDQSKQYTPEVRGVDPT